MLTYKQFDMFWSQKSIVLFTRPCAESDVVDEHVDVGGAEVTERQECLNTDIIS